MGGYSNTVISVIKRVPRKPRALALDEWAKIKYQLMIVVLSESLTRAMGYMPIAGAGRALCPGLDTALNPVG
ncbi:MAG: hypothetical protein DSO07_08290 [Thermoproteota archaeon]|uniref:Uncharacterized protein n=1 Tax=Candidatus Methanodesulfokora washburnensis TaxID=2478471 RepID=A0A3R9R0N7_9CREN|nr:hypothetical protein [Candidatus Methanodesulfokores washburnensis]RSN71744.1 hypothetical protein D6D85_15535 [Candidatus Methanodesulfokores washburnensis]TDA40728.1 MAG: hypothetical protein DSO07_08290 [Candidatus Korarchaeota archaeon]